MKQTLHNKFLVYLEKNAKMLSEEQRMEVVAVAEKHLPLFIRTYFIPTFGELYEHTDHNLYLLLRSKVASRTEAKEQNKIGNTEYTRVMKFYAGFLQSKIFRGKEVVKLADNELNEKVTKAVVDFSPAIGLKEDPLQPPQNPEEIFTEGRICQVSITKRERNHNLRQLCLQHYGYTCQVCGMDFEKRYGTIGHSFIEVHHINPIAETDGEYALDPQNGLIPLCSNCHSMIHRGPNGTVLKPEQLIEIVNNQKEQE